MGFLEAKSDEVDIDGDELMRLDPRLGVTRRADPWLALQKLLGW